jgi:hypothetical protein
MHKAWFTQKPVPWNMYGAKFSWNRRTYSHSLDLFCFFQSLLSEPLRPHLSQERWRYGTPKILKLAMISLTPVPS